MRINIGSRNEKEEINSLYLEQRGETVVVTDGAWDIITFRVKDDKLVFVRNEGVDEDYIGTDSDGRITEVEEYED
jgi:hypothetical protein